jgi:hypothetical protein
MESAKQILNGQGLALAKASPRLAPNCGSAKVRRPIARDLQLTDEEIKQAVSTPATAVDKALEDATFVTAFRGKALLRGIYHRLDLPTDQISFEQFSYAIAQRIAEEGTVRKIIEEVFNSLEESDRQAAVEPAPSNPGEGA